MDTFHSICVLHSLIYYSPACRLMADVARQQLAGAPLRCYFIVLLSIFALVLEGFDKRAPLLLSK